MPQHMLSPASRGHMAHKHHRARFEASAQTVKQYHPGAFLMKWFGSSLLSFHWVDERINRGRREGIVFRHRFCKTNVFVAAPWATQLAVKISANEIPPSSVGRVHMVVKAAMGTCVLWWCVYDTNEAPIHSLNEICVDI